MLSKTTYEVQYVTSDGALGRKSIVHRNRLKGVGSQAQKDILAEAQQRQEAVLSGRLGVSDEPEADDGDGDDRGTGAAGDQRGSFHIRHAGGESTRNMQSHEENRNNKGDEVTTRLSEERGGAGSLTSDTDRSAARFYIGTDEEEDAGEWTTVYRQHKGRGSMRGPGAAGAGGVDTPAAAEGDRGAAERRLLVGRWERGGPVGQQA